MRTVSDVCYRQVDGQELLLDIYLPNVECFDVFVYFHSGGLEHGDKSSAQRFSEYLADRGVATVSADYRLYPEAKYPEFIDDAAYACAWVKEHIGEYGRPKRIFVGGSSAGAYLSMMLCFDDSYLREHGFVPTDFDGFFHDSGQPTVHFNVLRERGLDTRKLVVDEAAPLYHIGQAAVYPPMVFAVATEDIENRHEQITLTLSTLRHFRYDISKISFRLINGTHCSHSTSVDVNGDNKLAVMIYDFIKSV